MTSRTSHWWQHGIIYQIYPRSFKDSNGDGIGDLRGITEQLKYLNWLGIDTIWISPFYPSQMVDFGYDVSNYIDVDPIFGNLAIYDELIQQAHQQGIKVLIDLVINHTSDQHPWFLEARSSRDAARRDWYVWANPQSAGEPPNNWISLFGGSAWEWDPATGQYYLHSFAKQQPDLNWRNPEVQAAMFDVLRFWLEHNVDGFRIDAAQMIMKDPLLRDNPLNLSGAKIMPKPMGDYDTQIHLHDKEHPDIHAIYRAIRRLLDSYSNEYPRIAVGEIHILDWKVWSSYYGTDLDEIHMPFNFGLIGSGWNAQAIRQSVDALEANLPPEAWPNHVLGNHDEPRIASRVGPAQARLAMLLLLTLRGTPTLYYGDEIGMHDGEIPPELVHDPLEKKKPGQGFGRDPERTPMQWDNSPNAGFCPPGTEPWLPISADFQQINVAAEQADPRSMLNLTRQLLKLRRATPALMSGSYRPLADAPENCLVYLRQLDKQRYLIALNLSDKEHSLQFPEQGQGQIVLSTHLDRAERADLSLLHLRGNEGCIIALDEESLA